MGSLNVPTFATLDGGMQGPGGTREFDRGGGQIQLFDGEAGLIVRGGLFASDVLLLGRKTCEHFAAAWPGMTAEEGYAGWISGIRKFVASTALRDPGSNAAVISDVAKDVDDPRQQQNPLVTGSGELVQTLREHDLADKDEVAIHSILVGAGKRLFEHSPDTANPRLADAKTTPKRISVHSYEVLRE
jgi:dihydrofolate reductase